MVRLEISMASGIGSDARTLYETNNFSVKSDKSKIINKCIKNMGLFCFNELNTCMFYNQTPLTSFIWPDTFSSDRPDLFPKNIITKLLWWV